MSSRRLEVDAHRIGRWALGFGDRHDGARVLTPASAGTGDAQIDDGGAHPAAGTTTQSGTGGTDHLVLLGGDGARAELVRWPGAGGERPGGTIDAEVDADCAEAIRIWARPPQHLGLILVRRGGYSVGLSDGPDLAAHKSGTRYVQSRTAAGGWSQQRFARRRGNQAAELVSAVAAHAERLLLPAPRGQAAVDPTALVLGGDRTLATQVLATPSLATLGALPQRMLADLPDPRHRVLQQALRRGRSIPILLTEDD